MISILLLWWKSLHFLEDFSSPLLFNNLNPGPENLDWLGETSIWTENYVGDWLHAHTNWTYTIEIVTVTRGHNFTKSVAGAIEENPPSWSSRFALGFSTDYQESSRNASIDWGYFLETKWEYDIDHGTEWWKESTSSPAFYRFLTEEKSGTRALKIRTVPAQTGGGKGGGL